jgi:acyl-CoA thioester hydrolase
MSPPICSNRSATVAAEFRWPIRVYYEDTDAGGVVYHASYLRFLERARTEWLRSRGIVQTSVVREHGVLFVVTELRSSFRSPARLDDCLSASCRLTDLGGVRLAFSQTLLRDSDNALLVEAEVEAACLDAASFRPKRIPAILLSELTE